MSVVSLSSSEGKPPAVESKGVKKVERGDGGAKHSMLTWLVVLALLGVWSSMAVLYLDIVDYDSIIGNCTFVLGIRAEQSPLKTSPSKQPITCLLSVLPPSLSPSPSPSPCSQSSGLSPQPF